MVEYVGLIGLVGKQVSLHIGQYRLFAQVIANDRGNEGVNGLIVGDAASDSIRQIYIASAIGIEESGNAQAGVVAETERIHKIVIDAPVDDVNATQTGGGARVHDIVVNQQVASLNQLDTHLLREEGMFKVGRIENAGR